MQGAARRCAQGIGFTRHVLFDDVADHRFRLCAEKLVDDFSVPEKLDGGQAADTPLSGQGLFLVGIDLGQRELALIVLRQFLQERHQYPARRAPLGPEIHDHQGLAGFFQDLCVKIGGGGVEDRWRLIHGNTLV